MIALALPAGQIVDLIDRKRVLIGTQIAFAGASALLTLGSFNAVIRVGNFTALSVWQGGSPSLQEVRQTATPAKP